MDRFIIQEIYKLLSNTVLLKYNRQKWKNLTQKQLAKKYKISFSYISKIEAGLIDPMNLTLKMIDKLIDAYF